MKKRLYAAILTLSLLLAPPLLVLSAEADVSGERMEMIALTFDDGPHPGNTGRILDVLKRYGVKATFFVLGCNATYYPKPLLRAIEEGHEIENHSMDHKTVGRSARELEECIGEAQRIITAMTGRRPRYFRPPEGRCSPEMRQALDTLGYETVFWTIDSEDWRGKPYLDIVESVLRSVRGNDIVLFHDYTCPNGNTVRALELLIPELLRRGYHFVTVEEMKNKTASLS